MRLSTALLLVAACGGGSSVPQPVQPARLPAGEGQGEATQIETVEEAARPFSPDAVARAVTLFASCLADDQPRSLAGNVYHENDYEPGWLSELQDNLGCLASARDGCAAVERCLGVSAERVATCRLGCEGQVAVGCDDSVQYRMDCVRLGQVCDPGSGRCRRAAHTPACDMESFLGRCEDGRPVFCASGYADGMHVYRGPRCGSLGLVCRGDMGAGDLAVCQGAGGECDTEHWAGLGYDVERGRCRDDGTLMACVNGGAHPVSCPTLADGFRCVRRDAELPGDTCGLGDECDPFDYQERARCEGTSLVFCNAGRLSRVDCTALGFAGCDPRVSRCGPGLWSIGLP